MFKKILPLFLLILSVSSLHAQTVAYVANIGDNTVSVIDTATNTVTNTISVGNGPLAVVFSPDGARAYVTNFGDGTISVIDTASKTVAATISLGGFIGFPAITPDGKRVYVPSGNGTVVIDTATNSVVSTISGGNPFAIAITPDGSLAYILGFDNVAVVDTATNTVVGGPISVPARSPFLAYPGIAITPAGNAAYVSPGNPDSGDIAVTAVSTATNTVSATIPVGVLPFGLAITPDGSKVYVADFFGPVFIIDTASNTLEPSSIPVGPGPFGVAITPDGAFVYVTNSGGLFGEGNTVSVIATATNTVVATVLVGNAPFGIAMAPVVPASGTTCNGTFNGTFKGNVTVTAGQSCTFTGGGVTGNVNLNGGNLTLIRSKVSGNLQITGASTFSVGPGTSVSGDLQVQNLPASAAQNQICGTNVHGNLVFQNSGAALLIGASSSCPGNSVGNDLTVQNNTAATSIIGNTVTGNLVDQSNTAPTQVFNNMVGNNLQCQNNTSISGGGNTAKSKQGQCTNF